MVHENDTFLPDEFTDELFLAVKGNHHVHIISGCSHRGITNMLKVAATELNANIGVVTGGFHLLNAGEDFVAWIADEFIKAGVQRIEVSHCTGIDQYHFLRKHFPGKVFYNHGGKVVILEEDT